MKRHFFQPQEVADYERKRYRRWDQRLVHQREIRIIGKFSRLVKTACPLVLDLPCGYGRFSPLLYQLGLAVVSADLSLAMVQRALSRGHGSPQSAGVVADALQGLPFRDNSFGLVLVMRFFHHLHHPQERKIVLSEIARVTTGDIILSFYRLNYLHLFQRKIRKWLKKTPTKIKMISWRELESELAAVGLKVRRRKNIFPFLHSQVIVWLQTSKAKTKS